MRRIVHQIRNHLAVVTANVEAFRDGMLEPTPARLDRVLEALAEVDALLRDLPGGPAERPAEPAVRDVAVWDVVANEIHGFATTAHEHDVTLTLRPADGKRRACLAFAGDPVRVAEVVNGVFSVVMHRVAAGSRIDLACGRAGGALQLAVVEELPDGPGGPTAIAAGLPEIRRFAAEHGAAIVRCVVDAQRAEFVLRLPGLPLDLRAHTRVDGTLSLL